MASTADVDASDLSTKRAAVACINCRKGKARCAVAVGHSDCRECTKKGKECIWVESNRGKWSRAAKRRRQTEDDCDTLAAPVIEENHSRPIELNTPRQELSGPSPASSSIISNAASQSDHVIDVHNPVHFKVDSALFPLGMLAEASRQVESSCSNTGPQEESTPEGEPNSPWGPSQPLGVANTRYFHDNSLQQLLPRSEIKGASHILVEQLVTSSQAEELFKIFFRMLNPQLGLLDARSVSPQSCRVRSPFLFLSVCAVASRFYEKGVLYNVLQEHARRAGMDSMLTSKSTATVQGFVILATWSQPSVTYETDNAYLYAGIAIRIGVEIGLHRKTVLRFPDDMDQSIKEIYNQEILSRERTWFCVFTLDRSMSALTGKPPQAPETYAVRDVDKWWRRPECMLSDVYISATAQMLRLLYRCFDVIYSCNDTFTGVSTGLNYQIVVKDLHWRLDEWAQIWTRNLDDFHRQHENDAPVELYKSNLRLLRYFYNLVPLSFGLQHCAVDGFNRVDQISFVTRCYECAWGTIEVARNELKSSRTIKVAPDICIVAIAYAACFLMKLIGPEFRHLFDENLVIESVESTAALLRKSAEDERHIHFLYSLFLQKQIQMYKSQTRSQSKPAGQNNQNTQGQSFMITNPLADMHITDIDIDMDGTLNFMSNSGIEIFRPSEHVSSAWIDNVLGMQSRRDDPFWPSLQGPLPDEHDPSFFSS